MVYVYCLLLLYVVRMELTVDTHKCRLGGVYLMAPYH